MLGVLLSRSSHLRKRGFDLVATSLVLILAAPLIAAIAILIKLDSDGPVFFRPDARLFGLDRTRLYRTPGISPASVRIR